MPPSPTRPATLVLAGALALLVVAAEVPAQTFAGPLAAGTPNGFAVRRGTNVSHWLSQSRRRGDERRGFFTREDVALAAKLGFDHLRIPVDEEQLFDESGRPIEEAFALLDAALDWCAEHRLRAIVDLCRRKAPAATIVLTAIFPRNDSRAGMPGIARINANLAAMADGTAVRFLDVNDRLADASGTLLEGMMPDGLHPGPKGYEVWAEGLRPILTELLGPPAATDHAPPPTGDPSAAERPRP